MRIATFGIRASASKKMQAGGGAVERGIVRKITATTCATLACLKEILADSHLAWVMDVKAGRAFVAGACSGKYVSIRVSEGCRRSKYGPLENNIPVVVNLLHNSFRFLTTVGFLMKSVSVCQIANKYHHELRGHSPKTMQIAVLASYKRNASHGDALRSGVGGTWVI